MATCDRRDEWGGMGQVETLSATLLGKPASGRTHWLLRLHTAFVSPLGVERLNRPLPALGVSDTPTQGLTAPDALGYYRQSGCALSSIGRRIPRVTCDHVDLQKSEHDIRGDTSTNTTR